MVKIQFSKDSKEDRKVASKEQQGLKTPRPSILIRRSTNEVQARRQLDEHAESKLHMMDSADDSDDEAEPSPIIVPAKFEKK